MYQAYIRLMYQAYIRLISGLHQAYVSGLYIRHISGLHQAYTRLISGLYQAFISGLYQAYICNYIRLRCRLRHVTGLAGSFRVGVCASGLGIGFQGLCCCVIQGQNLLHQPILAHLGLRSELESVRVAPRGRADLPKAPDPQINTRRSQSVAGLAPQWRRSRGRRLAAAQPSASAAHSNSGQRRESAGA